MEMHHVHLFHIQTMITDTRPKIINVLIYSYVKTPIVQVMEDTALFVVLREQRIIARGEQRILLKAENREHFSRTSDWYFVAFVTFFHSRSEKTAGPTFFYWQY